MVSSPDERIHMNFPVAYYHCATLDSDTIRRQCYEVKNGLEAVGLKVAAYVCDGASEHARFFELWLDEPAVDDPTLMIGKRRGVVISDAPHLIKKLRNILLSSGSHENHTKYLITPDGHHIGWAVIPAAYELATTNVDGQRRRFCIIPKFTPDVSHPTSIMRLRVSLAAIAFSKPLRDFVGRNISQIALKSHMREDDVRSTLEYLQMGDELFQIMNSKVAITWTDEDDGTGTKTVIGLRDKVRIHTHIHSYVHTFTYMYSYIHRWTPTRVIH